MVGILRTRSNLLARKVGKGQGLVEYALIVVLLSIASIVILSLLGSSIVSVFTTVNAPLVAP